MAELNTFNAEFDLLLPLETTVQSPMAAGPDSHNLFWTGRRWCSPAQFTEDKPTQRLKCLKQFKYSPEQPDNDQNNCKNKCNIDKPAQRGECK